MALKDLARIPTGRGKGSAGAAAGLAGIGKNDDKNTKSKEKNTNAVKTLTEGVALGNLLAKGITSLFQDVVKLLEPLIRLMGLLVFVAFLPLLPLIVSLTESMSRFILDVVDFGGGFTGIAKALMKNFDAGELAGLGALILGAFILAFGTGLAAIAFPLIIAGALAIWSADLGEMLVSKIGSWFTIVLTAITAGIIIALLAIATGLPLAVSAVIIGILIAFWEPVSNAFMNFVNWVKETFDLWDLVAVIFLGFPALVWKALVGEFLPGLISKLSGLGQMIWDAIKNAVSNIGSFFGFGNKKRAGGGSVFSSSTYLVGEKGPELFTPSSSGAIIPNNALGGGGSSITINNPTIRDERDIRKLTDAIGRELQKRGNRGFSGV